MAADEPGKSMIVFSGFHLPADQLVRLGYLNDFGYARQVFKGSRFDRAGVAGDADGGALGSRQRMRAQTEAGNRLANGLNLLLGCVGLHYD